MAGYDIKTIIKISEFTKAKILGSAPEGMLDDVCLTIRRWASDGADKLPEVTHDDTLKLMESIAFAQIAILSTPPTTEIGMILTDLNYSTLKHIKVHLEQQAIRLGRAHAKIDRLETEIARLISQKAWEDEDG